MFGIGKPLVALALAATCMAAPVIAQSLTLSAAEMQTRAIAIDTPAKWEGAVVEGKVMPRGAVNQMPKAAGYVMERCVEHAAAPAGTSLNAEYDDTRFVKVKNPTDSLYPDRRIGFAHPDIYDTYIFDNSSTYEIAEGKMAGTQGCMVVLAGPEAMENLSAMLTFARDMPSIKGAGLSPLFNAPETRAALKAAPVQLMKKTTVGTVSFIASAEGPDAVYVSVMVAR